MRKKVLAAIGTLVVGGVLMVGPLATQASAQPSQNQVQIVDHCLHFGLLTLCFPT